MRYVCAVCGREFEAYKGNHKYCGEECRKIGKTATRKQWEKNTDYAERQRIAAASKAKPKPQRRIPRDSHHVTVIKDGIAERLLNARSDSRRYWEIFKEYEITTAEHNGHFSKCQVNGISVYHPQFVELVLESIEREKQIVTTH